MAKFIKQHPLGNGISKDILQIVELRSAAWRFLSTIYKSSWDKLMVNNKNMSFKKCVSSQFSRKPTNISTSKPTNSKQANISRIPLPIPSRLSNSVLAKSEYFKKNQLLNIASKSNKQLYIQVFKGNIKEIIKIKNAFPKLSSEKIIEIHNITNNIKPKSKPKFNMTTKYFSKKQIIISMSINNSEEVISQANKHILNINKLLKSVKSNVSTDYI